MDFYGKVIMLCNEKGVSRTRMADDIGISRSTPKEWKDSGSTPRSDTVKKVADYFGVPVSFFYQTGDVAETINNQTINDNHGIIGSNHAPVTILGNSDRKLSEEEIELLNIFQSLGVLDKAKLLVYANELKGEK